jgi:hypothetical protein
MWCAGDNTHKLIARDFDAVVSLLGDLDEKILHCELYSSEAPAPMLTASADISMVGSTVKIRRQFRNYEAHWEYSDPHQSGLLLDS